MGFRRHGLAQRRRAVGFTQESFAECLGIDRSTIVRWEAGDTEPLPWLRPKIARSLRVSIDQLDQLLTTETEHVATGADAVPVEQLDGAAEQPCRHDHDAAAPSILRFPSLPIGGGRQSVNADASVMHSFRAADKKVGGGHLYATVITYLHTQMAPRLFGSHGTDGRLVFTSAASLTEMAGWMAHDAGKDATAHHHFSRSLDLVKIGGDRQLTAHIYGSMSHLANHRHQPDQAIQLARRGQQQLESGPPQPQLQAQLLAMQACGFAALRQPSVCTQLLMEAEETLSRTPTEVPSPWVSPFDEGGLASEAARCMRQLGDFSQAQRQAERVIELRPGDRVRSRAFAHLTLAAALIAQGEPDHACAVALDVLNATGSLGSYLVIEQLLDLEQQLQPYRPNTTVTDFLTCLDQTLRERMALYQWLAEDTAGQVVERGEDV